MKPSRSDDSPRGTNHPRCRQEHKCHSRLTLQLDLPVHHLPQESLLGLIRSIPTGNLSFRPSHNPGQLLRQMVHARRLRASGNRRRPAHKTQQVCSPGMSAVKIFPRSQGTNILRIRLSCLMSSFNAKSIFPLPLVSLTGHLCLPVAQSISPRPKDHIWDSLHWSTTATTVVNGLCHAIITITLTKIGD